MSHDEANESGKRDYLRINSSKSNACKKPHIASTSLLGEIKRRISENKIILPANGFLASSSTENRNFDKLGTNSIPQLPNLAETKLPEEKLSNNLIPCSSFTPKEDAGQAFSNNAEGVSPVSVERNRKSKFEDERSHYERLNQHSSKNSPAYLECKKNKYRQKRTGNRHTPWSSNLITDYSIIEKIGMGTYGNVYKGKHYKTGKYFALKRVHLSIDHEGFPITAVREIKILRTLRNENIVSLIEVVRNKEELLNLKKDVFYLVFEYLEHDLSGLIRAQVHFSPEEIGSLMKQLLKGLLYCHSNNYLHRDIKGSNILVSSRGKLKLADFGLARIYNSADKTRPYTNKVITLGYRPPELLLGEERYGPSIDVWSCGCILGELFKHRQIFKGSNEMEQLEAIISVCGSITPSIWPSAVNLPLYHVLSCRTNTSSVLKENFSFIPSDAFNLLEKMLVLDPAGRISVADALRIPWIEQTNIEEIKFKSLPRHRSYHEIDKVRPSSRHSRKNS